MSALKPITIVGGGLAGLTLGIGLRQKGIPATVQEAGSYPRHRVCGEFISGNGLEVLKRLDLLLPIREAGGRDASTVAFFNNHHSSAPRKLPRPALCLPRFKLEALLAARFRHCGGELQEHKRWRDVEFGEGIVRATGRRPRPVDQGWRWFGLKAHAHNVCMTADLEMHFAKDGYVGICRLAEDEVNVCGLFRRRASEYDAGGDWQQRLRGPEGSVLFQRLEAAAFLPESFCSVAGLCLRPCPAEELREVRVGDALTMIPPVTGNGMSIAFESAALAMTPLAAYSRGEMDWSEARQTISRCYEETFGRRLAWASWLQRALFSPMVRPLLFWMGSRWGAFWELSFWRTR